MDTFINRPKTITLPAKSEEILVRLNFYSKFKEYLRLRAARNADRKVFRHILSLEPAMLSDLGITRGDVYWAEKLPLTFSASLELQKIAHRL